MRAALVPDPGTASEYKWSSSKGPPFKVEAGTRVLVSVVVDRRPPISFVLPVVRRTLGVR
jgi:HlyD family secretion protein